MTFSLNDKHNNILKPNYFGIESLKKDFIHSLAENTDQIKEKLLANKNKLLEFSILNSSKSDLTKLYDKFIQNRINQSLGINPEKALALTNLGFSVAETGFEGWNLEETAELYSEIFDAINNQKAVFSHSVSPQMIKSLAQIKEAKEKKFKEAIENKDSSLHDHAIWIMQQIQQLSPGESYTMKGGWYGFPAGHSMIYRFECAKDGIFNLYVYDGANGNETLKGGRKESTKQKVPPCFLFENVTAQELFFSEGKHHNPSLIVNLLSLREQKLVTYNCGIQTVLKCFAYIKHRFKLNNESDLSLLISTQQAGNCQVKAMNCLLLHLENSYKKYKDISLDARLLTILAYYHYLQKIVFEEPQKQTELFMLKEAATNYLRVLDTNVEKQEIGITLAQYTTACATIYDLLKNLESLQEGLNKTKKPALLKETFHISSEVKKNTERQTYASKLPDILKVPPPNNASKTSGLSPKLGKEAKWKNVEEVLFQLDCIVDDYAKAGKNRELINQVEVTLRHLSNLKNEDFNSEDCLKADKILFLGGTLVKLQENYTQAVFELNDLASPSVLNTAMEFLALSYCLSLAGDKNYGVLNQFGLHVDYFFKFAREDHLFTIADPVLIKQRRELEIFFQKSKKRQHIFNFENVEFKEQSFLKKEMDDGAFLLGYIENHPKVREEFKEMCQGEKKGTFEAPYQAALQCFGSLKAFPLALAHIKFLKMSAVLSCGLSDIGMKRKNYSASMNQSGACLNIETKVSEWDTSRYRNPDFLKSSKIDFSLSDQIDSYSKNSQSSHNIPALHTENALLIEQGKNAYESKETDPYLPFYLALSEPDVQTTLLLNALEENLESLSDPHFCVILKTMFLKVVEKEGSMFSPFVDSLTDHQLVKIEQLVRHGKKVFVDSRPALHPLWNEFLFLIRLYGQGLQTFQSLHSTKTFSPARLQSIQDALQLLEKFESLSTLTEELKIEIKLGRIGLLLGTPLIQLSSNQQANLIIEVISLKNTIFSKSICSDYPFWRECKRKFFELEKQWITLFKQEEARNRFGNDLLEQALKHEEKLKWEYTGKQLTARSSNGECWFIDFVEPLIRNASGCLTEQYKDLGENDSLKRLFTGGRYHLKVFGEETHFYDAKWGNIRIFGKQNKGIIQRKIGTEWYTYIPKSNTEIKEGLKINDALFYDHTLWFKERNPQDIRIYDLKSAKEICRTEKGDFQHCETKKKFYHFENNPLIQKFEDLDYISGWIDSHENLLAFSRYCSEDGHHLTLRWNAKFNVWDYSINPDYHLDPNPNLNIDFETASFLPLVSKDGTKRKWLISSSDITSSGYSPKAHIDRKIGQRDGQKGSMTYFEYDLSGDGNLVAQTFDSNIYLAHLYLAQKRYQKALAVLKSIYSHDQVSKNSIQILQKFINSAEKLHDFSPNANSVRLHAFLLLYRVSPFAKEEVNKDSITKIYLSYINGQNDLESVLIFDPKTELKIIERIVDLGGSNQALDKRKKVLEEFYSTVITTTVDPQFNNAAEMVLLPSISINYFPEKQEDQNYWIEDFFNSNSECFLGNFEDFKEMFNDVKKADSPSSTKMQGIFYQILTRNIFRYPHNSTHDKRLMVLLLAAYFPHEISTFPSEKASENEKLTWFHEFKKFYESNRPSINNLKSNPLYFTTPKMVSNATKLPLSHGESIQIPLNKAFATPYSARNQDQNFSQIQHEFLEKVTDITIPPIVFLKDTIEPIQLHRSEQKYIKSIEERNKYYSRNCKKALENEKDKKRFKNDTNFDLLLKELLQECSKALDCEKKLKKSIETLANKSPFEFQNYVHHQVRLLGHVESKHDLETVLRASAQKDSVGALMKLNTYLSLEEAEELQAACIEFMKEFTHRQHLERVSVSLNKWLESGKQNQTEFEIAQETLAESRVYDIEPGNLPLLLFEYMSKMRIRKKQADIVKLVISILLESKDAKITSSAFQLIMGGGKTSIIISILIEMLSEAGLICLVMSHPSQFSSIKGSLTEFQPKRFKKSIHVLDYSIQDLSKSEILDYIIKTLDEAKDNRCPIIMKTTLPQIIYLKLIIEALNVRNGVSEEKKKGILKLQKILNIFYEKGVSIFDEGDINLSILLDVNIPIGKQKMIRPERSDLVKKIFNLLAQPELEHLLNFKKNKKIELSLHEYEDEVLSFVADKIFDYSPLKLKHVPQHKEAFKRYVCGLMDSEDQNFADDLTTDLLKLSQERQENILFIRELKKFSEDSDRYKKEAANLIAITRRMFDEILRTSLYRSNNRNYGRKKINDDGQIVAYEGAQTPTRRQFADVYLYLAYEYQSALEAGISESEIQFLAKKMTEAANHYAKKEHVPFGDTLEAKQFLKMTSVKLEEISDPVQLKKAFNYVNDPEHLERLLDVEAEVAPFHARYFPQKVKSNSINKVSMTKKSVTCSGTLWNSSTFHRSFGKAALDEGTEGSILNLHSKKERFSADGKSESIHEIDYPPLGSILNLIKKHPQKSRIRGLVDSGGFLKDHHNHQVADELLKIFAAVKENGGPQIDAVLYLHKYSKEEEAKGFPKEGFALRKPGESEPIPLHNTTKKVIEGHGVRTENLFVFFDEMRIIGTDVELADNALFLNTANQIQMSTALQGSIRARKVFKDQENEFIVTVKGRKEMVNGGKNFNDLSLTYAKNESKSLKAHEDRSRIGQIEDCVLSNIMQELREAKSIEALGEIAAKYEGFLVSTYADEPFLQYGRVEGLDKTTHVLGTYANILLKNFEKIRSPSFETVKNQIDDVIDHYKKIIPDDETMDKKIKEDLGCTLEVEIDEEIQLELEDEKEIDLGIEILNELEHLNFSENSCPYVEIPWKLHEQSSLSQQLEPHLLAFKNAKISSSLCNFSYYPENIKMTQNFYRTSIAELPLFHLFSKRAGFLLVTEKEKGKYNFILISEKEASFFKDWLSKHPCQDVILIDLQGIPEVENQELKLKITSEEIQKNLWYPQLFNANIDYLEEHENLSKELIKNNKDNISKYLQLKLAFNKRGLRKLFTTDLFDLKLTQQGQAQFSGVIFGDRRKYIEDCYNMVRRLNQDAVETIDPAKVEDLADHQIGWLITKEQIKNVAVEQAPYIKKDYRVYIEKAEAIVGLPDDEGLTTSQKQKIHDYFLKGFHESKLKIWHLQYLPASSVGLLKKESLIRAIPLKYAADISQEQACELSRQETELITHLSYPAFLGIKQNFIDLLVEKQIKRLDPKNPLDKVFITKLDAHQIGFLSDDALQYILPSQLKNISKKDFIRILKLELLLSPEAVPHLNSLTTQQIKVLSSEVGKFKVNSIPFFLLEYLTPEQIGKLTDKTRIKKLSSKQLKLLKKEQLNDFGINDFSPEFIKQLNHDAIKVLDKPSFCTLAKYLTQEQLKNLDGSLTGMIRQLSSEQLKDVKDSVLEKIDSWQAKSLSDHDLNRLTAPHLIQELGPDVLSKLNDQAIQLVKSSQLKTIKEKDFKRILKPELLISQEAVSHIPLLTEEQKRCVINFIHLSLKADDVPTHFLEFLSNNQVQDLTDKKKILKLPLDKVHLLKKEQLGQLERRDFSEGFVKHLNDTAIEVLNQPDLCLLSCYLTETQLKNLNPAFLNIIHCLDPEQIRSLDKTFLHIIHNLVRIQLQHVNNITLQEIKPSQLMTIPDDDFKRILNSTLLMTPEAAINYHLLTELQENILIEGVQKLQADQVPIHCLRFISDPQVKNLTDSARFKNLPLGKVHLLRSPQLINFDDFSKEFIEQMNDEAITVFNLKLTEFSKYLTQRHLARLDKSQTNIIKQLSSEQLRHVKNDVIQAISKTQVATLSKEDLNRLTNPDLLLAIPQKQLKELSKTTTKRLEKAVKEMSKAKNKNSLPPHLRSLAPKPLWR